MAIVDPPVVAATSADKERNKLGKLFCSQLQNAIQEGTFRSFTLIGPSNNKKKKKKKQNRQESDLDDEEDLRGCFKRISGRLVLVQRQKNEPRQLLQVTFKYHLATDVVKNWPMGHVASNFESLLLLNTLLDQENNKSAEASEWGPCNYPLGSRRGIQRATLETTTTLWELGVTYGIKKPELQKKQINESAKRDDQDSIMAMAHDRVKVVPIATSSDFLQALGVTDAQGRPRPGKTSKLRQIQKFVEIVSGLVDKKAFPSHADNHNFQRMAPSRISVVDMGCGRAYLTFALHAFLHNRFHTRGTDITTRGIDVRPKLVDEINGIVQSLDKQTFGGLVFETGTIESFLLETASTRQPEGAKEVTSSRTLEVLIALHACDTATDDALWAAIRRNATVICVAPCCHKELRPQIDSHASAMMKRTQMLQHPMADVLRFPTYRERVSETATDAVRALLLEMSGYDVNLFEFIGGEHTSKNVMITAVKKSYHPQNNLSSDIQDDLRNRLLVLAQFHGLTHQRLARWIGESLVTTATAQIAMQSSTTPGNFVSRRKMPPIF